MSLPHLWLAAFDHVCLLWFVSQGWMSVWSTTAAAPMYAWTGQSASSASAPLATGSWTKRLVAVNKDTLYRQTGREIKKKKNRVAGWLLIEQCVCVCVGCIALGRSQLSGCRSLFSVPSLSLPQGKWHCHTALSHILCPSHPSPSF